MLEAFNKGEFRVLTNCMLLTEGWNAPRVEALVLARPCSYAGAFLQIVGRGMRPSPGKTLLTVFDLCANWQKFGLPQDDRIFSLQGEAIRCAESAPAARRCPQCGAVSAPSEACPMCGFIFPPPPAIQVKRTVLELVQDGSIKINQRDAYLKFERDCIAKGYKPGFAAHKFKGVFGFSPTLGDIAKWRRGE